MRPAFSRSVAELSLISNLMLDFMCDTHGSLLQDFNQIWLLPQQLEQYEAAVSDKSSPLAHCQGFIEWTVKPVCCLTFVNTSHERKTEENFYEMFIFTYILVVGLYTERKM